MLLILKKQFLEIKLLTKKEWNYKFLILLKLSFEINKRAVFERKLIKT